VVPPFLLLFASLQSNGFAECPAVRSLNPDFGVADRSFEYVASRADWSEPCRKLALYELARSLGGYDGPCPGQRCAVLDSSAKSVEAFLDGHKADLCDASEACADARKDCGACRLTSDASNELKSVDAMLALVAEHETAIVEQKIGQGRIPYCLIPRDCPGDGCGKALSRKWSDDILSKATVPLPKTERWIAEGGFTHLLLASAFTCGAGEQVGGTCVMYSGASLLSHYCATPRFNPAAANSCTNAGPDFRCPSPDELRQAAWEAGIWRTTRCAVDEAGKRSNCVPTADTSRDDIEGFLNRRLSDVCPQDKADTPECRQLAADIEKARQDAAHPPQAASVDGGGGVAWVSGTDGAVIRKMGEVYRKFGFETALYKADEDGWERVMRRALDGYPVQVGFDFTDWTYYWRPGSHAVVVEGAFLDPAGTSWILLKDSNYPSWVKLFPAANLKAAYLRDHSGATSLCPPSDAAACAPDAQP
jgi:hypothetical protein